MKNYYKILEVDKKASNKIIKGVYKLHIKENHPDLFQGPEKELAEERLKEINEAYEVLNNDVKRKKYDELLEQEEKDEISFLKEDNNILKSALKNNKVTEEYEDECEDIHYSSEYVPDEQTTYMNNAKYITKLLGKERLVKIVVTICIVIAASVGIYKSTGFNLLKVLWNAIISAFS